ncbi:DUF1704 domain-containing protein [Candidatus Nomurabacteria bacterium]|uniref:DUF1704 domain-containing protein n=1 Tax=Candidatus Dojkabacteria bacterium TaxID=2099670 RepID=A0A955I1Y9_9BACT|nr:DUF1704 domain-containing protein [Candidatus Dojkabacteria bacterium]MCB9789729.1 DUF1704 domain-containing protein [Candidatus Nomurabacteria bacterium]MCB9803826.1 DUF1704 domain-containing protein [Candidatus Nomurabacteria bacterium]
MTIFTKKGKKNMKLAELTEILHELRIPTSLVLTPTNLNTEMEKFLNSEDYNPQFEYRIVNNKNDKLFQILASLESVTDVDPRLSEFYIQLIESKKLSSDLMHAVGDNVRFTKLSIKRFRMPTPVLFRNACRVLRRYVSMYDLSEPKKDRRKMGFDEVAAVINTVLEEFELKEWSANKSMNIAQNGMKVGVKNKEILIDPNIETTPSRLRKSIVHEFTHVIRSHNGLKTGYEALSKPTYGDYLEVEEGLAVYNEEIMGLLSYSDLRKGAVSAWGTYIGQEMSFRELHNVYSSIYTKKNAFLRVLRVKRGLGDTSMPGIYSKDVAYFRGFRRVRKKCAEDATLYAKLYAGKINFKQVSWVDDGLIRKPAIVPSKQRFEKAFKKAGI